MKIEAKLVKIGDEYGFEVLEGFIETKILEEGKSYELKF